MQRKYGHTYVYPKPLPELSIVQGKSSKLGNCYHQTIYEVTSSARLSCERLKSLKALGVMGVGQGFEVTSQCDGAEEPGLFAPSELTELDPDGRATDNEPSGKFVNYEYFVYRIKIRCDSSG